MTTDISNSYKSTIMNTGTNLYILHSKDGKRYVIANSRSAAIHHIERSDSEFAEAESVEVQWVKDVQVASGERSLLETAPVAPSNTPPHPVSKKVMKVAGKAKKDAPLASSKERTEMDVPNNEAADMIGCNAKAIQNMKYRGTLQSRVRLTVTRESIDAYLAQRDAKPLPVQEATSSTSDGSEWMPIAKANDTMVHIDKAALQLNMAPTQVSEIKTNGRVPGGNGWVNMTVLAAYMKHPSYEPPFGTV